MRRTLLPVVAAILLGLSVAACGGDDDAASGCSPVDADLAVMQAERQLQADDVESALHDAPQ